MKILEEHNNKSIASVQENNIETSQMYGHVVRRNEEHICWVGVEIPANIITVRPNLRWIDACRRDMTIAGLIEDDLTNRTGLSVRKALT